MFSVILNHKNFHMKRKIINSFGFTIIETMIVLAIAGLIMAIIFIALSQEQSSQRDNQRKAYSRQVLQAQEEYLKNNGIFPGCRGGCTAKDQDDAKRFISLYMPEGKDPSSGNSYSSSSLVASSGNSTACTSDVVSTSTSTTVFCYNPGQIEHDFVPQLGQIVIGVGHWCYNTSPDDGNGPPLAGPDTDFSRIVIVIGLEKGYYCIDNYAG
jgi:prepilin-type N-terminal cleavage/methylation domain-containing protein